MSFASTLNLAGKRMTGNTVRTQNGNSFYSVFSFTISLTVKWSGLAPGVSECSRDFHRRFFRQWVNYAYFLVLAASSIANIVKSSLGPVGLDKMLVDDVGVCFFYYRHHLFYISTLSAGFKPIFCLFRMSQSPMMELPFWICLRLNTQQLKY